jgi:hypothetical protein
VASRKLCERSKQKRNLISVAVKKRAKGDSENELKIRLRQSKCRARSPSVSADAGVRFCPFLFRHRNHVQDRHSSVGVQLDLLDELGESTVETRKREKPVGYTSNLKEKL